MRNAGSPDVDSRQAARVVQHDVTDSDTDSFFSAYNCDDFGNPACPEEATEPAFEAGCRACFNGDEAALSAVLSSPAWTADALVQTDKHGLTMLHIAAMRNSSKCIKLLLEAGADARQKSIGGWLAVEEAICYSSSLASSALIAEHRRLLTSKLHEQIARLSQVLQDMPDCAFQISWELSSPYLGAVLHKHLPKDTYTVWKCGGRLRVDGHMKGMNEDAATLLPTWKYGHFSLLIDTTDRSKKPLYVSHDKKRYTVLDVLSTSSKDETQTFDDSMFGVGSDVSSSRIKFSNFRLAPVKGWLTAETREKVHGMSTVLYEAQGELMAVTTMKPQLKLPNHATYDDYLAQPQVPNVEASVPLNFSSGFSTTAADDVARSAVEQPSASADESKAAALLAGDNKSSTGAAHHSQRKGRRGNAASTHNHRVTAAEAMVHSTAGTTPSAVLVNEGTPAATLKLRTKGSGRKVKARLWLAQGLPINQRQLLPLLDIISTQNKYIGKVGKFMQQYGDQELFPVKVQIPLVLSMRIMLHVKTICVWSASDKNARTTCAKAPQNMRTAPAPDFFCAPPGYAEMSLEELGKEKRKKAHKPKSQHKRTSHSSSASKRSSIGEAAATHSATAQPDKDPTDGAAHPSALPGLLPVADWPSSCHENAAEGPP